MGTEFSLLLNRLLSVLGDSKDLGRDKFQFIIIQQTDNDMEESASLFCWFIDIRRGKKGECGYQVRLELEISWKEKIDGPTMEDLANSFNDLSVKSRVQVEENSLSFFDFQKVKSHVENEFSKNSPEERWKRRLQLHLESWAHLTSKKFFYVQIASRMALNKRRFRICNKIRRHTCRLGNKLTDNIQGECSYYGTICLKAQMINYVKIH